jgi:hypothetical protein
VLPTYKAILKDNQLRWSGDVPKQIEDIAVEVYVTILDTANLDRDTSNRGKNMAAALERLAESNALGEISDPINWQREQRQDRKLPGRDS